MNPKDLMTLGLTLSQAQAYLFLVQRGKLTPAELIEETGESRTNAYMILDRLEKLRLAFKDEEDKKLVYRPNSPVGLEQLAERQRVKAFQLEVKIKDAMPELFNYYHSLRSQPGVRFLQGRKALLEVYKDHLDAGTDVQIFRTAADEDYFGDDLYDYMKQRAEKGIKTELISPYFPGAEAYAKENDASLNREVTWTPPETYTAPVEITIYGSKVSITSFGEEAIATIIESPQIAEALRQIFVLAKVGAKQLRKKRAESSLTKNISEWGTN